MGFDPAASGSLLRPRAGDRAERNPCSNFGADQQCHILSATFAATGAVGWVYLLRACALGTGFIVRAVRLASSEGVNGAKALYLYSLLYPALLFGAMMADSLANRYLFA